MQLPRLREEGVCSNYLGARMRELSAEGQLLLATEGPAGPGRS